MTKKGNYQAGVNAINTGGGGISSMGSMLQPIIANEIEELSRKLRGHRAAAPQTKPHPEGSRKTEGVI